MTLNDLDFVAADCCREHLTATATRSDGTDVGLLKLDDGTYSVTLYRNGGLWKRECCVDAERAQALLDGAE